MVTIGTNPTSVTVGTTRRTIAVNDSNPNRVCNLSTSRKVIALDTYRVCASVPIPPSETDVNNPLLISLPANQTMVRGQPIYITDDGKLGLAGSESQASIGIATEDGVVGAMVPYTSDGHVVRSNWSTVTGSLELQPGKIYYLGATGALTSVTPTTGIAQRIGVAASKYMLDVEIDQAVQLI